MEANSTKIDDELQWLESVVNGFEQYRFQKNELFTVLDKDISLEKTNKNQTKFLKSFQVIKAAPN